VLCLSLVMIVMANASLNVALPTLAGSLHTGASGLQWIVDAYSLVFAGLLLTAGSLGDRYGRRLALNGGLIVFGAASLFAAYSSSVGAVIGARAVMGIGAAFVMPATLSILAHVFPPKERARAIAIWAGFAGVGVAMGGVVSGALLEEFWWGSIFLINVVVVIVALTAGFFLIPRSREKIHAPLDPLGAVLSIAGLASLVYGITVNPSRARVFVASSSPCASIGRRSASATSPSPVIGSARNGWSRPSRCSKVSTTASRSERASAARSSATSARPRISRAVATSKESAGKIALATARARSAIAIAMAFSLRTSTPRPGSFGAISRKPIRWPG